MTAINDFAFCHCDALTELALPDTVSRLGSSAFGNCGELASVNIPKALCEEGGSASSPFKDCPKLDQITFASGITAIPDNLFFCCTGLTKIDIPETVTSIGRNAFNQCSALHDVNLPHALETLGSSAFASCTAIESIVIPKTLTSAEYAFSGCQSLRDITLEKGLERIPAHLFDGCNGFETVAIPDSVTSIGDGAFHHSSLKSIEIPDSVTAIESSAFYGSQLESITIPDSVSRIDNYLFRDCASLTEIDLGASVTAIGMYAFSGCQSLEAIISRAEDITDISATAFQNIDHVTFYAPHTAETLRAAVRSMNNNSRFIGTDAHDTMTWSWNGLDSATLTIACEHCDIEPCELDAVITSEITAQPTCTADGVRTYTASVPLISDIAYTDKKTEAIAATGHHYGQPQWTWNADGTVTAAFTCTKGDDTQTVNAEVSSEITKPATYEEGGVCTLTAKVTFNGTVYTDTKPEPIPRLYHIGDANLDGRVDIRDVTAIQRHLAEVEPLSEQGLAVADTNGDGVVDIDDATWLQMVLAEFDTMPKNQPA